jgi:hypothetical protein
MMFFIPCFADPMFLNFGTGVARVPERSDEMECQHD